jgi:hypothetical protein
MASKKNVFSCDLERLISKLVTLNHYQFFVSGQLGMAKKSFAKQLEFVNAKGYPQEALSWGSTILMVDIFRTGEVTRHGGAGGRVTNGKDILAFAEEMERRFSAFQMVYLFEALERFLKAAFGKMLFQLRRELPIRGKDIKAFLRKKPAWAGRQGTPKFFEAFAAYECRSDCKKAVTVFDKQLDWSRAASDVFGTMKFHEFIAVLATCRHAIVHKEGAVTPEAISSLSKSQNSFLKLCMHKSLHGGETAILPPTKLVDQCYEDVASYARGLYVLLSERCGMSDDTLYFEHDRRK